MWRQVRGRLADAEAAGRKGQEVAAGAGEADTNRDKEELAKMAAEIERISMQLVTASLGHAQVIMLSLFLNYFTTLVPLLLSDAPVADEHGEDEEKGVSMGFPCNQPQLVTDQ